MTDRFCAKHSILTTSINFRCPNCTPEAVTLTGDFPYVSADQWIPSKPWARSAVVSCDSFFFSAYAQSARLVIVPAELAN